MSFFFDSQGNLRAGWKLSAFIAVLMPVWIATNFAGTLIFDSLVGLGDPLHDLALSVMINWTTVVVATVFAAFVIEQTSIQAFGMGFHEAWAGNFGTGVAIAAGLIILALLGTRVLGETHIAWTASQVAPGRFVLTFGMLTVAAAFEELLFRGYPLQALMKGIGPWPAMIAMSCVFGWLHSLNPSSSRLGIFNTVVAGMMLSLAYFKTRSLWLPYGLHLGWNVGLGMIVGFPLSGLGVSSLWTTHTTGPQWLLGGGYGPEGGVVGTAIFLAGVVTVWKFPMEKIHYDDRFHKNTRTG